MKVKSFMLLLILPMLTLIAKAQDTVTIHYGDGFGLEHDDTILANTPYDEIIVYGDRILPGTQNQFEANYHWLYFSGFIMEADSIDDPGSGGNVIDSVYMHDSALFVKTTLSEGCCEKWLFDISVVGDTALNLLSYDYGPTFECACESSVYITYQIDLFDEKADDTMYEIEAGYRKKLKKIKSVMLNGDKKHAKNIRKLLRRFTSTFKDTPARLRPKE